ncbi:hypothetical protein [Marinisporobacter balticus]|uniref:Uncharacterized protein n=1 Tax=Marinisporobacter balticus TaxID=2018667 RepID=A0A4R2KGE8_9FIRM|nr:hypothetical protein [Marinisporobacter balticus]TCO72184.1 hypothetical protein EV214_11948 [Marinisporobacter balticus]
MKLQHFVIDTIEAMHGVVDLLEYALCYVMLPDEYSHYFNGKTEMLLAFDFEVAQENPKAEFITFGSYTLEQLTTIAHEKSISTIRYAVIDRLSLLKAEDKIKKFLDMDKSQLEILQQKEIMGRWVCFNYKIGYTAHERTEELKDIWINLQNGAIDTKIQENKNLIFHEKNLTTNYPIPEQHSVFEAFENAYSYVKIEAEEYSNVMVDKIEFSKELQRIDEYYNELEIENSKKLERKGVTDKRKSELISKAEALKLERLRQKKEMESKYTVDIDIALDNAVIYFIPLIEYHINLKFQGIVEKKTLHYNPVIKSFYKVPSNI